MSKNVDIVYRM